MNNEIKKIIRELKDSIKEHKKEKHSISAGMGMTREEFKKKWESSEYGGGITIGDVANCYIEWGLGNSPYTKSIDYVIWRVCENANTNDKKYWEKRALRSDE